MFCPDVAQKGVMFCAILLVVVFVILFNHQPLLPQLLPSGAIVNLTSNGILPLLQLAITDELSASIATMDKYNICPAFDPYNQVFGNF